MSMTGFSRTDPRASEVTNKIARVTLVDVLLACGVAYSLSYLVANDVVAATRYEGYSRTSQAVSELSATGAPTRAFLMFMLPIWTALMVAFGIGVWKAAEAKHSIRIVGALLVTFGITGLLWLAFPMTSRQEMVSGTTPANDAGHIAMTGLTVVLIIAQLVFGAAAFGRKFQIYSLVTAAIVLIFGGLTGTQAPKIPNGEPTPWMGLFERINIGAWLLWIAVLAILLIRARHHMTSIETASDAGCFSSSPRLSAHNRRDPSHGSEPATGAPPVAGGDHRA
jgi:hypothetical protein